MTPFETYAAILMSVIVVLAVYIVWNGEQLKRLDREIALREREQEAARHPGE